MLRICIYAIIWACWLYAFYFDVFYVPSLSSKSWFGKLFYLTIINMVIQTVYFGCCTIRAIVDEIREPKVHRRQRTSSNPHTANYYPPSKFHTFCDNFYATTAFPIGLFVVLMFWSLYSIDRELVYPKVLDKIIPHWLNHVLHTAPAPFLLVDTLLVCHRYPSVRTGLFVGAILTTIYLTEIVVVYQVWNQWIYPVFSVLDTTQIVAFFALGYVSNAALFYLGYTLNNLVWGTPSHPPAMTPSVSAPAKLKAPTGKPKRA